MPEPVREESLLSPSSLIFALESPTSMASPSLLMFTSSMVTFAVAPSEVDMVMVLSVAAELSRCEMTGASSATAAPPPCDTADTVCPWVARAPGYPPPPKTVRRECRHGHPHYQHKRDNAGYEPFHFSLNVRSFLLYIVDTYKMRLVYNPIITAFPCSVKLI